MRADKQPSIGFDAHKQIKGRKRHLSVDTLGLPFAAAVTAASVQDRDGAFLTLNQLGPMEEELVRLYVDAAYRGFLVDFVAYVSDWVLEIVNKPAYQKGFAVQPRHWIVERPFAAVGALPPSGMRPRIPGRCEHRDDQNGDSFSYGQATNPILSF